MRVEGQGSRKRQSACGPACSLRLSEKQKKQQAEAAGTNGLLEMSKSFRRDNLGNDGSRDASFHMVSFPHKPSFSPPTASTANDEPLSLLKPNSYYVKNLF